MKLLDNLRLRLENWRFVRRARAAYRMDIKLSGFSTYLLKRVKGTMQDSLSMGASHYEEAFKALRYLRNVHQVVLASPDITPEERLTIIGKLASLLVRFSESTFLFDDSLLLAMSGRYTSALSILRSAIECMITGAFYNGLIYPELRTRIKRDLRWKPRGSSETIGEIIERIIKSNPDVANSGFLLEARVEQDLTQHNPSLLPPGFRAMLKSVIAMYSLFPLRRPFTYIYNELYQELCAFTHVSQEATSFWAQSGERVEFDSGSYSQGRTEQFVNYFLRGLDSVGVVFFSSAFDLLDTPRALEMFLVLEHDIGEYVDKLPYSKQSVLALLKVERAN